MRSPGFTLVEVLAVVMILALLSALGLPVIVRWAGTARELEWYARLQAVERAARQEAIGHDLAIALSATGMAKTDRATGENQVLLDLPSGLHLSWSRPGGEPLARLVYDHHGRSADALLRAQVAGREFRATLSGLTGEWSALQAAPLGPP